jgi:hypothetical protein
LNVLANKELQQWCFVDSAKEEEQCDAVYMSSKGDMVKHTTIEMDRKTFLQQLDVDGWERLK